MEGKRAIITLMRGNPGDYRRWQDNLVVLRNKSVDFNLKNKCDFIIFHEGNLTKEHQSYVVERSLISSPIKFVEISDYKTLDIEFRKRLIDRGAYESGYASMCRFWFTTFIEYLSDYDYVIRIDDDCIVDTNVDQVFDELVDRYIVSPQISDEEHRIGLVEFINEFLQNNNIELDDTNFGESFKGPYTNYCGFNLDKIRNNPIIMDYIKKIKDSEYIYTKNWQDVSLWGSVMRCFLAEDDYKELKAVSYFHLSHLNYPNGKRKK